MGRGRRHGARARRPARADPRRGRAASATSRCSSRLLRGRGHGDVLRANVEFVRRSAPGT
jgi:hypothetical protein